MSRIHLFLFIILHSTQKSNTEAHIYAGQRLVRRCFPPYMSGNSMKKKSQYAGEEGCPQANVPVLFHLFQFCSSFFEQNGTLFSRILSALKRRCSNCSSFLNKLFFIKGFLFILLAYAKVYKKKWNKWNNRRNNPSLSGFRLFQLFLAKWNKIFEIAREAREYAGIVCSNFFGTKWNNDILSPLPSPRTQSIKCIERSEIAACAPTSPSERLRAVLRHEKSPRGTREPKRV